MSTTSARTVSLRCPSSWSGRTPPRGGCLRPTGQAVATPREAATLRCGCRRALAIKIKITLTFTIVRRRPPPWWAQRGARRSATTRSARRRRRPPVGLGLRLVDRPIQLGARACGSGSLGSATLGVPSASSPAAHSLSRRCSRRAARHGWCAGDKTRAGRRKRVAGHGAEAGGTSTGAADFRSEGAVVKTAVVVTVMVAVLVMVVRSLVSIGRVASMSPS